MSGHPAIEELWLELEEGTLPAGQAAELAAHADACPSCGERLRRLREAHLLSVEAGRAAQRLDARPVPPELERRILGAVRASARPARRLQWLPALAAAGALTAAALGLWPREPREVGALRASLALLARPPAGRGPVDATGLVASELLRAWEAGALSHAAARLDCAGRPASVAALRDGAGAVRLLALGRGELLDLYLYGPAGEAQASVRLEAGAPAEHLLQPLPAAEAQELLRAPRCGDPLP